MEYGKILPWDVVLMCGFVDSSDTKSPQIAKVTVPEVKF
jgi:hypothetical protein